MFSNTVKYKLYPTLLNRFDRFEKGYISETELLNNINRLPVPQTEAQRKGVSFEEAVIKGIDEEEFDPEIISGVRALLPRPMLKTQVYCEYQIENVLLYGYVDVLGKIVAVDIKTTSNYVPGCYADSHQNFYLPALRSKGIRSLKYVITDFKKVYQEEYDHSIDFSAQMRQIKTFCEFLETHRHKITDVRVFGS
ncbi:hypothetical protein MUK70_22425 [Dyadobacter chenwenxiniae]|uniref:PD-(D/E)XK nuclease superfamily protein n=1 Tax=Dyadobacter chenwenxiniae TaxID=2906456 RepID=A0A9X1PNU9_9BACT|nr:hypothetical protein [Dyadobacter chenwenxiniae]MCF0062001.1 hypothetical protein [Dyadobacter chenwenxiniae]UON81811.1 hypothetical protein MUK70_22425 [Dyadobacter chenwenxiniae]